MVNMSPYDVFRMEDPFTTTIKGYHSVVLVALVSVILVCKVDVLMPRFGIVLS